MFQVTQGTKVIEVCATLQAAAQALLQLPILDGPRVVCHGKTLIEVAWRYIPGDCYEPSGYSTHTGDAALALMCAQALQRIRMDVGSAIGQAKRDLRGVRFQVPSAVGPVDVQLAWDIWSGFDMEIHDAGTGHIVYSAVLDDRIYRRSSLEGVYELQAPALDYFVAKALALGIELPQTKVDLIHARAEAGLTEAGWGDLNGFVYASAIAA